MKRQSNALTAVLENWQDVESAIDIYANSAGSAMRENEIYLDSWEAKSKALSASWNEFVNTFLNADMFKGFIGGATEVLKWLTDVNAMLPIVAGLISGLLASAILKGTFTLEGFNAALIKTNILSGGIPMLIGAIVTLVGVGISWAATAFDTAKQIENLNTKIQEQQTEIDKLTAKEKDVVELYKEYESLMSKSKAYGLTASEKENLLKISKELVNTYGLEVSGIDEVTGAYVVGANAINQYVEALRKERNEKEQKQEKTRNKRINKNIDSIKKNSAQYDAEQVKKDIGKYISKNAQDEARENKGKATYGGTGMGTFANANKPVSQMELPDYIKSIDNPVVKRLIKQTSLSPEDISELENALLKDKVEYESIVNSVVKDILTNIQVNNADMLDSNSESLLTQMLTPYLTTVDWDKFNKTDFEKKVKAFANSSSQTLSNIAAESKAISARISSDGVAISDYKDLIENQTKQLGGIKEMFGENSDAAKEFQKNMENSAKSNVGMMFADISNDMKNANLDTSKFDNLATSILRLDKSMADGKITFSQYVGELNKQLDGVSLETTFQGNTDAANEFFSALTTKGKSAVQNLTAQMQKGAISQKEYVKGLSDIASYFVKLGDKAETLPGIEGETVTAINEYSSELDGIIKQLEQYSALIEKMPTTWEDFKKSGQSGVNSLIKSFKDAGVTAEDLGYTAGTSIDSIVQKMWNGKTDFDKVQEAMKTKFKATLKQMGVAIANLINELTKQFGNVKFTVKAPEGGWWAALKKAVKGEDLSFGLGVETDIDPEAFGDAVANALGDLNFGNGFSSGGVKTGGIPVDTKDGSGSKKKASFDDNYYSTVDAWLSENEKEINKLTEERESLNRQFENALDAGNKEQAEILRAKLIENAKKQKEILHNQNEAHRITKGDLLTALYGIAPELSGKSWEEISDVALTQIENRLNNDVEMAGDDDNKKNKAKLTLNTFKGIIDDIKAVDSAIKENSEAWWNNDEEISGYWKSQIDLQESYSREWIDNEKAFGRLREREELAAYERIINNNKEFQKQILAEEGLSAEAKLALIKETNDLIVNAEKDAYDVRKGLLSKATDFGNTYLESQKTLLQAHFDVENSIAEARHEINKELKTSMTMYEYLNEETRQLLFNQEDYNKLNKELNRIENESLRIQSAYEEKLRGATLETVESITSEYQMQYETLMKSYEIAKADLEIAKKKQKLNNVLNERNVRMFINGSWQWVANTEDVINAKSELADAVYAKQVEQAGLTQQESINNLTKQQDELGVVIKKFENGVIDLGEAIYLAEQAIGDMPSALASIFNNAKTTSSSSNNVVRGGNSGGGLNSSYVSWAKSQMATNSANWHTADENGKKALEAANQALGAAIGSDYDKASGTWKHAYASGSKNTQSGLALMGENGFEAYINSNGRLIPINQPTIGNISNGGVVFNTDQMKNLRTLWDMSSLNLGGRSNLIGNSQPQQIDQSQDNRIIINGMTVDSGSADGQSLIDALKRYVGNH